MPEHEPSSIPWLGILAPMLLASCATTQPGAPTPAPKPDAHAERLSNYLARQNLAVAEKKIDTIWQYRIDGYNVVDDSSLIMTNGASEKYLVNLMFPCTGLQTSSQIGFTTTTSNLTTHDKVLVPGGFGQPGGCPIADIHLLEAAETPAAANP